GSKDPYALRRAVLGVIRLILESRIRLHLVQGIGLAHDAYLTSFRELFALNAKSDKERFKLWPLDWDAPAPERAEYYVDMDALALGGALELKVEKGRPVKQDPERFAYFAPANDTIRDLLAFFADRLKVVLREKGVRHDLIDAVFALGGEDDLVRLLARV